MSERGPAAPPPLVGTVVTEQQLSEALDSVLRDGNAFTSLNGVVQQLESNLGVNLNHKMTKSTSFVARSTISFSSNASPKFSCPNTTSRRTILPSIRIPIFTPLLPRIFPQLSQYIIPWRVSDSDRLSRPSSSYLSLSRFHQWW